MRLIKIEKSSIGDNETERSPKKRNKNEKLKTMDVLSFRRKASERTPSSPSL